MQLRQKHQFTTIRTEGSILPADLLQRINEREAGLAGLKPDDYAMPRPAKTGVDFRRVALERTIKCYEHWNAAQPGKGYDRQAAAWREKLEPATQPSGVSP